MDELIAVQIFTAYVIGSLVGYYVATSRTVTSVINRLIDDGFLRTRTDDEGDTVIVRYYDNTK